MSDLISRQEAIDALNKEYHGMLSDESMKIYQIKKWLSALPSADVVQIPIKLEKRYPQSRDEDITDAFMRGYLAGRSSADRPTGEWVDDCTCSICHWMHEDNNGFALITKYNYCPNCGAKMRGEEE